MRCPHCDNLQPDSATVCIYCGHSLEQVPPPPPPSRPDLTPPPPPVVPAPVTAGGTVYCTQCGANVPEGSPFCPACGQRQGQAERAERMSSTPAPRPVAHPSEELPPGRTRRPEHAGRATAPEQSPRKVSVWPWIAGAAVVGIGLALWLLWPETDYPPSTEDLPPQEYSTPAPSLPSSAPDLAPSPSGSDPDTEARKEWEAARARLDEAFREYTTLATTGGEGNIQEALARYRQRLQELQEIERKHGMPVTR